MTINNFKLILLTIPLILGFQDLKGQDFEVAPVKLEFDAEPSMNQTKTISVKNHSNKKTSFVISISDFLPNSKGELVALPPNSSKRSCANWININPSFFDVNPGDDIQIQITMLVPGEDYGSAWCMLYIQPATEQTSWSVDKTLGAGVTVTGRIGVLLSQSPKSNTNHSLKISNFSEVTQLGDINRKFSATIENIGDKVTKFKVFLLASNIATAEEKQFKPQELEIYPKMTRAIELVLPNELPTGQYALAAIVDYGPKYPLEGAQIVIDVVNKDSRTLSVPDTTRHN